MRMIYIGSQVNMNDKRTGIVFAILKDDPSDGEEDWTYLVDVEGERRECSMDDFRVDQYNVPSLERVTDVLAHQQAISEAIVEEETRRLDKISTALGLYRAVI